MMESQSQKYRKIGSKELTLMDKRLEILEAELRKLENLKEAIEVEFGGD